MNSYITIKLKNDEYILCKILNKYSSEIDADNDLIKLSTKKITEKQLLKEYNKSI